MTIATRGKTQDKFGYSIKRMVIDGEDAAQWSSELGESKYDIVYDQICYSPDDAFAAIKVFKDRVKKYVFTSPMAVYSSVQRCTIDKDDAWNYASHQE